MTAGERPLGDAERAGLVAQLRELEAFVEKSDAAGESLLREAGERFGWSARAYYRVLKVARTIADLAATDTPNASQIAEAVQYRRVFSPC